MAVPIMAIIAAAQAAYELAPKKGEIENRREIRNLEMRKEAGTLGLTQQERDAAWADTYAPAEAKVREQRIRQAQTQAATGATYGGQQAAGDAAQLNATALSAAQAGQAIAQMDVAEREAENQELTDRMAVADGDKTRRIRGAGNAVEEFAKVKGRYEGTTGEDMADPSKASSVDGEVDVDTSKMDPATLEAYTDYKAAMDSGDPEAIRLAEDALRKAGWVPPEEQDVPPAPVYPSK